MEIIAKEYYKLGENLLFVIRGFTNDVSLTIQTIKSGKYIFRNTFGWTTSDTQTSTTFLFSDALDDNGTKYFIIEIPKESLLKTISTSYLLMMVTHKQKSLFLLEILLLLHRK